MKTILKYNHFFLINIFSQKVNKSYYLILKKIDEYKKKKFNEK